MEQLPASSTKIATKWAVIYVLTGIVITYIIQYTNMDPNSPMRFVAYVPFIAFLLLAQKEFKDQLGGYIKFGEAFSTGMRYGVFSGLLFGVFLYIYLAMLSPEILAKSAEAQRDALTTKGLTSEQVENAITLTKKYGALLGGFGVAIWYALLGILIGLIGAFIFKNERSPFDTEDLIPVDEPTV